jgi:GC-rich sequence DNA-binding factor
MTEEADAGSSSSGLAFIKRKSKVRGSANGSASSRQSLLKSSEQDQANDDDEEPVAIRRTAGIGSRGKSVSKGSTRSTRPGTTSALSFGDDAIEPAFQLKKSALAQAARESKAISDNVPPDSLDQASIAGSFNGYSAAALAALKASTPARRRGLDMDGDLNLAHQEMIDPSTQYDENGHSLSRPSFGADFTLEGIPSEALVNAAKERRRRAAEDGIDTGPSENFISLRDSTAEQEPHPESRLQREEDDEGSGEEEFAEFTGATERVALGQNAIRQAKKREIDERREAMDLDEDDDSGQEWERAQMGRIDVAISRKQREKREVSPFRPAAIPMTAPLPSLSSTSARLAVKVAALESSIKSHGQVIDDAVRQLQQMEGDEIRNKKSIEVIGEKEAWFRELEDFVISLSTFLDDKMPLLEDIEMDWKQALVDRTRTVQRKQAVIMTDQACLFYGVPAGSLLGRAPTSPEQTESDEENLSEQDGGALSVIRETRRANLPAAGEGLMIEDAAFLSAQKDIQRRLRQLLDDVKAPEFTDPAVRLESRLHPSSLVARFHQWRRLYPDEYANAWGGLTLAGIWEFWVRREICGWDLVQIGSMGLDEFQWHKEMTRYSALASQQNGTAKEDNGEVHAEQLGGDDEMISHVISNTIVPRIIDCVQAGAYNPWSTSDCQSMMNLLEQISYVLERDNVRFISLVSSFLHTFEPHIDAVIKGLILNPPISAPPPFDPRAPIARISFLQSLKTLLFNMLLMNRYVSASERPFYVDLIDRLVGKLIWNLLGSAKETGGKQIAQEILQRCEKGNLLKDDIRARFAAMASSL